MSHMVSNFIKWSTVMQFYRVPIIGATILIQCCILAPLVLFTMATGQATDIQMPIITIFTFLTVVMSLSDMPTKITIPIFAGSTILTFGMIIYNLLF